MTTSGESESDDSEMGRLQGIKVVTNLPFWLLVACKSPHLHKFCMTFNWESCILFHCL